MDDVISRRAAIEGIRKLYIENPTINNDYVYDMALDQAADIISTLPSAQPQENDKGFANQIHAMFDHIWDCEIEHPVFQDTVGDLMQAVIQAYHNAAQPEEKTRADRIRAMPDEELAAFIEDIAPHDEWSFWLDGKTWLDWLKSPAERANGET